MRSCSENLVSTTDNRQSVEVNAIHTSRKEASDELASKHRHVSRARDNRQEAGSFHPLGRAVP